MRDKELMYNPKHFCADDIAQMHDLIRHHSFAILVTQHAGAPFATHLPFLLDARRGRHGTLLAHLARPNPQWHDLAAGQEALAIFQGPHAYISPSWYGVVPSVPTWNYAAVHASGTARIVDDPAELRAMLARLVDENESRFEQPWRMDLPEDYMDRMMRGVVGFEIAITRLEGKLKMSQNRSADDRRRVVDALERHGDHATAAMVEGALSGAQ
jgi:transcriptional regulator